MNELKEKQTELFEVFEKLVINYTKKFSVSINVQEYFLNVELRRQFLKDYKDKISKKEVEDYLKKEDELETLEKEFYKNIETYLEVCGAIQSGHIGIQDIDVINQCLKEAYEEYNSHFRGISMSVNNKIKDENNINLTSFEMSNSIHESFDSILSIEPQNINHLLGIASPKNNQQPNMLLKIYNLVTGNPIEQGNFNTEDYIKFLINDGFKYLKYIKGETTALTKEEVEKISSIIEDINIDELDLSKMLEKSISFLLVYKYKYLPEIIIDYDGDKDLKYKYGENRGENSLKVASFTRKENDRDAEELTRPGAAEQENAQNPNCFIVSYQEDKEIIDTLKTKYYTLIALASVLNTIEVDEKSNPDIKKLLDKIPNTKPTTNHLQSLCKIQETFSKIESKSDINEIIRDLNKINKELSTHQISDSNIQRAVNLDYLRELFLEIIYYKKTPEAKIASYDTLIKEKFDALDKVNKILESMLKYNDFFQAEDYEQNKEFYHNLILRDIEPLEIRKLIPLVNEIFKENDEEPLRAIIIGFYLSEDDNYAKTNLNKTLVQLDNDLRIRGRNYRIDSIYHENLIYKLTTVRQYENRNLLVGKERITNLPLIISERLERQRIKNNSKNKAIQNNIDILAIIYNGDIIYNGFVDYSNIENVIKDVVDKYQIPEEDLDIYQHIADLNGWIRYQDDPIAENVIVSTIIQATTNQEYLIIEKDEGPVILKITDKDGDYLYIGDKVTGSDGLEYTIKDVITDIDYDKLENEYILDYGNIYYKIESPDLLAKLQKYISKRNNKRK